MAGAMRDWKKIAEALGAGIPPEELDRVVASLDGLEAAFRPLAAELPHETEPAVVLLCEPEGRQ